MRRRIVLAAVLLDGLCALGAPLLVPALHADAGTPFVEVAGACVEVIEGATVEGADAVGRPVDATFCQ